MRLIYKNVSLLPDEVTHSTLSSRLYPRKAWLGIITAEILSPKPALSVRLKTF